MGGSDQYQGAQTGAWANLNKLFGTATDSSASLNTSGTAEKSTGLSDLGKSADYWQTLLGGDRQATAAAVAPAANAATNAADATKKEQASFGTGRTGGAVAGNQQTDDKVRSQIDTLIGSQRGEAAGQLANIGATTAGIGEADIAAMLQSLGIASGTQSSVGGEATAANAAAQQAQAQLWSSLISGAAKVGAAFVPPPKQP